MQSSRFTIPGTVIGVLFVALSGVFAGCFNASLPEVAFRCGENDECPSGYECREDGCCHKIGSPDVPADYCAPLPDASLEAGVDAADIDSAVVEDAEATDASVLEDGEVVDAEPGITLVSMEPTQGIVTESETIDLTVTISDTAPVGGVVIDLATASPSIVSVPASVTVLTGQTSATFQVSGVSAGDATVMATLGNSMESDILVATPISTPGDLVITEFLAVGSVAGTAEEFVEVLNVGSTAVDISGWILTVDATAHTVAAADLSNGPVHLAPGERGFGVPNPSNPSNIPAGALFVYGTAGAAQEMDDMGSVISIGDATAVADEVDFTSFVTSTALTPAAADFPGLVGLSTQLAGSTCTGATANDNGSCWCVPAAPTPGAANRSCSAILINEALIDPAGNDLRNEFLELYGPAGADLAGFSVRAGLHNGGNSGIAVDLPAGTRMPMDSLFVLADGNGNNSNVANKDLEGTLGFDNAGGGIQLIRPNTSLSDALGYGTLSVYLSLFNILPLVESSTADAATPLAEGSSLSRNANSADTDDNDADFSLDATPTPGAVNSP